MVFNISKEKIGIRKGGIHGHPWQPNVFKPATNTPTLDIKDYQGPMFQEKALTDY